MGGLRVFLVVLATLFTVGHAGSAAADNPRYAAFVVDETTGEVLHARRADDARYPASLTKMMTLYMLFEALERGEVTLSTPMTVSRHAAGQSPSVLGVESGDTVTVETAIRALIIRSANDIAVVVGEHLAGTETAFATRMTSRARELGLTRTTFRNASGLPNSRQMTTARDMARLAIALHRDFPQYFHYFRERSFVHDGRTWRSHNNLVGRVNGVDGMKTGYIRASGFNIAVTAERGGHRIVTVVMGGPSAASRDNHAEELVNAAFRSFERREQILMAANDIAPRMNPIRMQDQIAVEIAQLDLRGPVAQGDADNMPALRVVLDDSPAPAREPVTPAVRQSEPAALPATVRTTAADAPSGQWAIQVGAYAGEAAALARLETVRTLASDLSSAALATPSVDTNGRRLFRARFEGVTADTARAVCRLLAERGEACFAVAPGA
ncbi:MULTISPECIES: D-alanyl-D-alanine carboxypeptidase family protein [Hyphobacterium]|uniref:Serine hydrolase n=1 Tax=Hyphobacterium vulgare TaxID=1736751 RepID=A0ABV6ZTW9_9PROT